MKPRSVFPVLAFSLAFNFSSPRLHAAVLERVGNTSLKMPADPPVYGFKLAPITNAAGNPVTFSLPVGFATPPGETNRLFVIEKTGDIAVITNLASPNRTVFLNLSNQVQQQLGTSEGGVLGLAFHPDYKSNGYFYVYYVGSDTTVATGMHDILSRFQVDAANPNHASTNTELKFIHQYDTIASHNAGDVHFGPDGYLYLSLGDEGSGGNVNGDPRANSQRIDKNLFSAVLRIDVDKKPGNMLPNSHPSNTTNYFIPADNPFIGATSFNDLPVDPNNVRTEFYAVGFRNPFRFSFDPASGRLLLGDVGLKDREEINDVVKGGNYGWAFREGTTNGTRYLEAPPDFTSIPPIFEYGHVATATLNWPPQFSTNQGGTVIGGVVYHGDRLSQLDGYYVFGDYDYGIIEPAGQHIWAFKYDGTNISNFQTLLIAKQIVAYGIAPDNGDVLLACMTNTASSGANASFNSILRLVYNTNAVEGTPPPPTLADTGAFADLATLTPNPGIVPYTINVPFWSDNAIKSRWFSVPDTNLTIGFSPKSNWSFPTGTIWIKHFELELTNGVVSSRKRLETRLIIRNADGVYGVTYRWGNSLTNANLVPEEGMDESFLINEGGGILRTQIWHYPSRAQCLRCHTGQGGFGLGFNTAQLNCDYDYGGTVTNQIVALSGAGYLNTNIASSHTFRSLAAATNTAISLEYRVRSYLAANCRQCHQGPIGSALWDASITTPTALAGLIHGALVDNFGNVDNSVIAPGSLTNSVLYTRVSSFGSLRMPPLDSNVLDTNDIAILAAWITNSLPGYENFETWQSNHVWTVAADADLSADPDHDGAVNYLEYLTGTDPLNSADLWKINIQRSGKDVRIVFPQIANRGFQVEYADQLTDAMNWTPLDEPGNAPFFSISNSTETVVDMPVNSNRYYRVRVFEP